VSQHNNVLHPQTRYNRTDFTALRAWLSGLSLEFILDRYYPVDCELFPNGVSDLGKALTAMREDLIARMIDTNPKAAQLMADLRKMRSWGKSALDYLCSAADAKATLPYPNDPITAWFKPIAAKRLKSDGILTLADLIDTIRQRGKGWFYPIPCLGPGKARKIEGWLLSNRDTLPALPSFLGQDTAITPGLPSVKILERFSRTLLPLEGILPASDLDGTQGENRHHQRPLISARNDYDAVQAYLYKYRGQDKTWIAYRKELERFLLWSISERGKAMSDLMVDDCEAYKDFLAEIPPRWIGPRRKRQTPEWKPFSAPLSAESQKYAITCLRSFFAWLVDVRYLSANPFVAVQLPATARQIHRMQINKALPKSLWEKFSQPGGILDEICSLSEMDIRERYRLRKFGTTQTAVDIYLPQVRVLRAAVLLLGATGIRREELAFASRKYLLPFPTQPGVWQLAVLGKRSKWRYVYPTDREIGALRAHWADRAENFDIPSDTPLISPVNFPGTTNSQTKHLDSETAVGGKGYSVAGINRLVHTWLTRFADDDMLELTAEERDMLARTGIHAFRHTFGTLAVADDMPLDVVQGLLGHASLDTTTIYVRATEDRAAEAIGRWRNRS